MNRFSASAFILTAGLGSAVLVGCGGSSSSTPAVPAAAFSPLPVLVPGSAFTYAGEFSEVITYASPSPQQPNSTGAYKTTDLEKISSAPSGAPGPIEVARALRYNATDVPTSGLEPKQRSIDSYQSSTVASGSQTIEEFEGMTTTTGIDQTANRARGNGPYAYHSTIETTYPAAHVILVFPLVQGTTQEPLARSVATVFHAANAAGSVYTDRNTTSKFTDAGAYVETGTIGPGENSSVKAYANGTARLTNDGAAPLEERIFLPTPSPAGGFQIPVSRTSGGIKRAFLAADWYPGNAAPPSPLASTGQTVTGASHLPSACHVKVAAPNVQEVDTSSSELNVVLGRYTIGTSKEFLSNGTTVCRHTSSTTKNYNVETGALVSTTADSFTESLVSESIP